MRRPARASATRTPEMTGTSGSTPETSAGRITPRPSVALPHPVSLVDVTGRDLTVVTLAPDGVDVFLPQEPPDEQMLSALRVVLGDLASRGQAAATIDLTGREVIAVRPLPAAASAFAPAADSLGRPNTRDPRRG